MADIQLTPGTLPPPACYDSEQARFDAYVAAIVASVTGGLQWEASQVAPTDLSLFWLRLDANNRPVEALQWSTADGQWVRWRSQLRNTGTSGGAANAYTITNTPAMTAATAYVTGAVYIVTAAANNTGASTLNIDGLGTRPIVYPDGVTPVGQGDIKTGQQMILVYDGVSFQLVSTTANTAASGSQLLTSTGAGNYLVPGGVFSIEVECVGGGGGGGYSGSCRGGGGAGYSYKRWSVTPGQSIAYTIGAGGTKGTNFGTPNSTNGGDTTFNATQTAYGGASGDTGGLGGVNLGGDYGFDGEAGGTTTAQDNPGKYKGGKGAYGASYGGVWDGATASDGYVGGGGCGDNDSGGGGQNSNGGDGIILIKW